MAFVLGLWRARNEEVGRVDCTRLEPYYDEKWKMLNAQCSMLNAPRALTQWANGFQGLSSEARTLAWTALDVSESPRALVGLRGRLARVLEFQKQL